MSAIDAQRPALDCDTLHVIEFEARAPEDILGSDKREIEHMLMVDGIEFVFEESCEIREFEYSRTTRLKRDAYAGGEVPDIGHMREYVAPIEHIGLPSVLQ